MRLKISIQAPAQTFLVALFELFPDEWATNEADYAETLAARDGTLSFFNHDPDGQKDLGDVHVLDVRALQTLQTEVHCLILRLIQGIATNDIQCWYPDLVDQYQSILQETDAHDCPESSYWIGWRPWTSETKC